MDIIISHMFLWFCALCKIFYHYLPHELKLGHKNFCFLSFWHLIKKNKCIIFLSQNFQWGRIWVKRLYTILICQQICKCTFGDEQLTKLQDWLSLKTELTSFVLRLSSRELCRIPEKENSKISSQLSKQYVLKKLEFTKYLSSSIFSEFQLFTALDSYR